MKPTLCAGQAKVATALGFRDGIDFTWYEQVPLGPGDLIWDPSGAPRMIDRRTVDGSMLAADGSNARVG